MEGPEFGFADELEDVDTGESMAPQPQEEEEEEQSPEEILAKANGEDVPTEVLLSVYNQEISEQREERPIKVHGIRIPDDKRSKSNAVLTTIELAAILIRRAIQLQNNKPTALGEELRRGSYFNKYMTDAEYRAWYEKAVTDFAYAAKLEYELGYLDDWEIVKDFGDGFYEVWKVRELPFLRR